MCEENSPFHDYSKGEDSDDEESIRDLQSRLYAEIYYRSVEIETNDNAKENSSQSNIIVNKLKSSNVDYIHEDKITSKSNECNKGKGIIEIKLNCNSNSKVYCKTQQITSHSTSQNLNELDRSIVTQQKYLTKQVKPVSKISIQFDREELIDQEYINNAESPNYSNAIICDNDNNKTLDRGNCVRMEKKEDFEINKSTKDMQSKHENSTEDGAELANEEMHTKCNILPKKQKTLIDYLILDKETDTDTDSANSVIELPIPPKPLPVIVSLSDDENSASEEFELISEKWYNKIPPKIIDSQVSLSENPELEILEPHNQDASTNLDSDKSPYNRNVTINSERNMEYPEDLILNCITTDRRTKHLSNKFAMQNYEDTLMEDANMITRVISLENSSRNVFTESTIYKRSENNNCETSKNLSHNISFNYNPRSKKRYYEDSFENQDSLTKKKQCYRDQNIPIMMKNVMSTERKKMSEEQWTKYFFKPMSKRLRNFYNNSRGQEHFDIHKIRRTMSRDPKKWAIINADKKRAVSNNKRSICNNCEEDHFQRICPRFKSDHCRICGKESHSSTRCPQNVCLSCGRKQNVLRKTCETCYVMHCDRCNSVGHNSEHCPDLWRRYHQITHPHQPLQDPGNVMKPPELLYCCNCSKRGHEAYTCTQFQWSQHFFTPAVVTNYTDGPVYEQKTTNSHDNQTDELSSNIENNEILILDSPKVMTPRVEESLPLPNTSQVGKYSEFPLEMNMLQSTTEDMKLHKNIQETACASKTAKYLVSSAEAKNKAKWKDFENFRKIELNKLKFSNILYSCGVIDETQNGIGILIKNISSKIKKGKVDQNRTKSLVEYNIAPIFLEKLSKNCDFHVTIGKVANEAKIMLQVIMHKKYIDFLHALIKYWLFLPDDEKYFGVDVNLPREPKKLFKLLQHKHKQLAQRNNQDPRELYSSIRKLKSSLRRSKEIDPKDPEHIKLLYLQSILLHIFITESKPSSKHIRRLLNLLKYVESCTYEYIDIGEYLKILLSYNILFVPHTPGNVSQQIRHILQERAKLKEKEHKQDFNPISNNSSHLLPAPISDTPNIKFEITPSTSYAMPVVHEEINKALSRTNCERAIVIDDYVINSQNISLNTEQIKPVDFEYPQNSKQQSSVSIVKNECNRTINQQNTNRKQIQTKEEEQKPLSKKARKKLKKKAKQENKIKLNWFTTPDFKKLKKEAGKVINEARTFNVPHIRTAIHHLNQKIRRQTLKQKNINMLSKLLKFENKCQN